jgi:alkylated DNA nucleotide flippase Atl1
LMATQTGEDHQLWFKMEEASIVSVDGVDGVMRDKAPSAETSAEARKRRIAARRSGGAPDTEAAPKRRRVDTMDDDSSSDCDESEPPPDKVLSFASLASIKGIKKQARYVPEVPMTKEQVKAWRREARRIRNRESAAECRRRTRDRIAELEEQLSELESKYQAAQERIAQLETRVKVFENHEPLPPKAQGGYDDLSPSQRSVSPSSVSLESVSPQASPLHGSTIHAPHEPFVPLHLDRQPRPDQESKLAQPAPSSSPPHHLMFSRPIAIGVS